MKKAVISFTHTNYCIRSAGTEKFVRSISTLLQNNGYSHLNFFSFYDDRNLMRIRLVGVNYNDKFQGIYKYEDVNKIIQKYSAEKELQYVSIHLQHLLHHEKNVLIKVINELNIPVYYFTHDYYAICESMNLIDSNNRFCGLSSPTESKCKNCSYAKSAIAHNAMMRNFFRTISGNLKYIITPSEYVTNGIKNVFPEFGNIVVTRPHLVVSGQNCMPEIREKKIKVGFAGVQTAIKGFDYYKRLVNELVGNKNYEFYYLGKGNTVISGVKNIYVSSTEQGEDAMIKAIKSNGIDIIFLWPNWPETYSYVYYELSVAGAFTVTNSISGNIADEVRSNKNGVIFIDYEKCIEWFKNTNVVRTMINNYRKNGIFIPEKFSNNEDLSHLISNIGADACSMKTTDKVFKRYFLTLLYCYKYKNVLKTGEWK